MACEDIKKLIDANDRRIRQINDLSKAEQKKTSGVKQIVTGIASALEGMGGEFGIGVSVGVASGKIVLKPKHSQVAAGAIKAWEGWQEFQDGGGKVPTLASVLALLKKLRSNLLKEYAKCLKSYYWAGSITYTFTEEFSGKSHARGHLDESFDEEQVWTTTGAPADDDLTIYPAEWSTTTSFKRFQVISQPDPGTPPQRRWRKTSDDPKGECELEIEVTGNKYVITNAGPPLAFSRAFRAQRPAEHGDNGANVFEFDLYEFLFGDLEGTVSADGTRIQGRKGPKPSNRSMLDLIGDSFAGEESGRIKGKYSLAWSFRRMRKSE